MIRSKYNIDFLPEDFQKYILKKIQSEGISFRISSPRKSKLGDYKYIYSKKIHAISVNIDLSEIQFLITFIHELAHKKCYDIYAGRVSAHGIEWKTLFVKLLIEAKKELTLSSDWKEVLMNNVSQPRATFREFSKGSEEHVLVSELNMHTKFELKNGRKFKLIKKRRTRYLCSDLINGQLYAVSGKAPVERLI